MRDSKYIIVVTILLSLMIKWWKEKWRPSRDMVWVLVGVRGCVLRPTGHSLVTLFFLSMLVKDRPLYWTLGKSQIYYPEHILGYGHREDLLLSYRGFRLFPDRLSGFCFGGGGPCTALSPRLKGGGLESHFGWRPGPHD